MYSEGQFLLPDMLKAHAAEDSTTTGPGGPRKIRIGASISSAPAVPYVADSRGGSSGSTPAPKSVAGEVGKEKDPSAAGAHATLGQGKVVQQGIDSGGGGGEAGPIGKLVEGILTEEAFEGEDEEDDDVEGEDALVFEDHGDYQDYDEDDDEYY